MLDSLYQNTLSKAPSRLSRLERSLVSVESRRFQHDSTQPLGKFFQGVGHSLRCFIDDRESETQEEAQVCFVW